MCGNHSLLYRDIRLFPPPISWSTSIFEHMYKHFFWQVRCQIAVHLMPSLRRCTLECYFWQSGTFCVEVCWGHSPFLGALEQNQTFPVQLGAHAHAMLNIEVNSEWTGSWEIPTDSYIPRQMPKTFALPCRFSNLLRAFMSTASAWHDGKDGNRAENRMRTYWNRCKKMLQVHLKKKKKSTTDYLIMQIPPSVGDVAGNI